MQTSFTPEQLRDPQTARANQELRACVHCGFCTATCPSYQVLGDELDSPRGRIYLIKDMLEQGRPADAHTVRHLDRCLSCLSCMTTCPSGVNYMHLIDHARAHVEATHRRPLPDRLLRALLAHLLPHPGRMRLAMRLGRIARPLARLMPDARLRAMLRMVPARLPPVAAHEAPATLPASGTRRMRVALQLGCAQRALNTDISDAAIRLLQRLGAEVVILGGQGCCGALTQHMGRRADAMASARAAIGLFAAEHAREPLDAIVITASGCGTTIKDYGHMFQDDPDMAADAARVGALALDITEVITRLGLPEQPRRGLRVAYHAACSLQHGQRVKDAPRQLLTRAGFDVVEPADSHLCCGSAGTYNLLQPAIADTLRARKVATLERTAPDVIATGNLGCMVQIGQGTALPIVHVVELMDWATGGPRPQALSHAKA